PQFSIREKAERFLLSREYAPRPALRKAQEQPQSLEARRRIESLLERLSDLSSTPEVLRTWRAVLVLEQIGNGEARSHLSNLAKGAAEARLTQLAEAALERLKCRA